ALLGLEAVVLLDRHPQQPAALLGQLVPPPRELLLLLEQRVALRLPLLVGADPVLRHVVPPVRPSRRSLGGRRHRPRLIRSGARRPCGSAWRAGPGGLSPRRRRARCRPGSRRATTMVRERR